MSFEWAQHLTSCLKERRSFVLVTIIAKLGSTPRESGAKMLVLENQIIGTIGGGNLEFHVMQKARQFLKNRFSHLHREEISLGASAGQCCGGRQEVLYEPFFFSDFRLHLFGAGHIAKALIEILANLPIIIRWIDDRTEIYPSTIPQNIDIVSTDEPVVEVEAIKTNHAALIMTHNHALDLEIIYQILHQKRGNFLGMIGSEKKKQRFLHKMRQRGIDAKQSERLICPIGIAGIRNKHQKSIAISVAAQMVSHFERIAQEELNRISEKIS